MGTLESWQALLGAWTGTNQLILPDEPIRESASAATVAQIVQGKFCAISYSWAFEGEPQEGQVLFGCDSEGRALEGIFIDSWHMGDKLMRLEGQAGAAGTIDLLGSYAVEGGPDWGWRVVIEPGNGAWRLLMYNVAPDGQQYLGVEANYTHAIA
jgi:hypothetical protein